jgi:hypothetical protein
MIRFKPDGTTFKVSDGRKESKMKKIAVLVALLCVVTVFAFAQAPATSGEAHAEVGDLIVGGGVNFGWASIGLGGGAELMLARWDIPGFAPLTFGATGKVGVYVGSSIHIDIAALGTMHFGLKTFTSLPQFLQNFDWYWGLGLGVGIGTYGGLGLSTGSGISYYINPNLAIAADYFYTNYFGSGTGSCSTLGVKLEL